MRRFLPSTASLVQSGELEGNDAAAGLESRGQWIRGSFPLPQVVSGRHSSKIYTSDPGRNASNMTRTEPMRRDEPTFGTIGVFVTGLRLKGAGL